MLTKHARNEILTKVTNMKILLILSFELFTLRKLN